MPKDNEVDEKVVAYGRDLDGTGSLHPCAKGDIGAIALCDAATVAELRAKADAAERRVAALQECAVRYLKWLRVSKPEAALEHDLHDAGMCGDKALTGADPT